MSYQQTPLPAPLPPRHDNTGLKPSKPPLGAQLEAAATEATVDVLEIEYNNGGDPVWERELQLEAQNEGKTREEVRKTVENDGILRGLAARGIKARLVV